MELRRLHKNVVLSIYLIVAVCYGEPIRDQYCVHNFDKLTCSYFSSCSRFVTDFNDYQNSDYIQSICSRNFDYGDIRTRTPIHMTFRDIVKESNDVPRFHSSDLDNRIVSLDISHNDYIFCPTITAMNNLEHLNISRNSLTTADLSNSHELQSLTDIDFSYNFINTIVVDKYAHSYTLLKKINLSHNYLVAIPDATFVQFNKINSLDLAHNYINELNVLTFEGMKNIVQLNLSHNRISAINSSLLRFNKLTQLDLSYNRIENILTSDYEKLTALEVLDLSFNVIKNINNDVFDNLIFLRKLDLNNNVIEIVDENSFSNVNNLENINLSTNKIKVLPKGLFKDKQIQFFSIKDNLLEGPLLKRMFEGLTLVTELDLSYQLLNSIEDFAFLGLDEIATLLLNNNNIHTLSVNSFKTILKVKLLDLSNNKISNINFAKDDLVNLRSLLLHNNHLTEVNSEYFSGINILSSLDLSNNQILELDSNSFKSLNELIDIKLSNNPINGTLKEKTFGGLLLLPNLDISGTLLTKISNNSFLGMTQLKDLNMSHSRINELQYNTFYDTGAIEVLDLSYNELKSFNLNNTVLINLSVLILNNNLLSVISSSSFQGFERLLNVIVSHNQLVTIHNDAFNDQKDLRNLDLSFNSQLQFNVLQIKNCKFLANLFLSAIGTNITFENIGDVAISELDISNSGIRNITKLELNRLKKLESLVLRKNELVKVEIGSFSNVTQLRQLDLSSNKIQFIQPGVFRDNTLLSSLNISHNDLTTVSYGIFRGLIYLQTIDISFNNIDNLESERFYELISLTTLIADNNKIKTFNISEFYGTSLFTLSIGGNPLSCDVLVNSKKVDMPYEITAIIKDETSENHDGITCNVNGSRAKQKPTYEKNTENYNILIDIRDVIRNLSNTKGTENHFDPINIDSQYVNVITSQIKNSSTDLKNVLDQLVNLTTNIVDETKNRIDLKNILTQINNLTTNIVDVNKNSSTDLNKVLSELTNGNQNTNLLLDQIVKLLKTNDSRKSVPVPIPNVNSTFDWMPIINKIKEELEDTLSVEKQNILNEVESKISSINSLKESSSVTATPAHEAFSSIEKSESRSFIFIEVCVGLILTVLVGFILYKFYNSGMFVPSARSLSTRHLPESIENSAL